MWKILAVDNFNREYVSDILLAENMSEHWAKLIAAYLVKTHCNELSDKYYIAVPQNRPLYKFEP